MISIDILRLGFCNISDLDILRLIVVQNEVYLPNNNIHGELPEWVWSNWSNITALSLSNNFITNIGNKIPLQNLLYLYLGSNFLKGQLPILPHFITELDLSNNQFHGEIKPSICRLTTYFLDLSNNSLNEALPHCFWMMSSPTVLDLHMNNFQGTIPHTFFMNNLQDLNLRGNNFEGEVPRSLINCSSLEFLDLSENNFTDTFPIWFGDFPRLRVLSLRSNKFHGPVSLSHASTFAFSNLQILDLSYNQFTGNLPPTLFLRLQKMTRAGVTDYMHYFGDSYPITSELANDHTPSYHDSLTMVLNGNIMPFDRIAELMVSMDLSCNHFEGEIPNSIGGLIAIRQLSLAHNNFTGHIPPQLGDLSNLQSLDLSCNQLDGNIPDKFAALGFLSTMNLSYNHLTGQIPSGRLLQVIPNNSYIGNDGLCGFPLSRSYENLEPSPHGGLPNEEDDEEFFDGLTWQSVVMGYCVGICIGLVIGSLILVTGKPKWLVRMIEEEAYRMIRRYKGRNGISMTWNMRS